MPDIPAEFLNTEPRATQPQVKWICDLIDQRNMFASPKWFDAVNAMDKEEYAAYLKHFKEHVVPNLSKADASRWIDRLLALPKKPREARANGNGGPPKVEEYPGVPQGRYALRDDADQLNPVKFYQVEEGRDYTARGGRDWTGCLFVTRFSSDEKFPVRGNAGRAVLDAIAADPKGAALLFGREENRCCICGRRLTRRLSRALGIGPVCGGRNGWLTNDVINDARQVLVAAGYDPDEEMEAS